MTKTPAEIAMGNQALWIRTVLAVVGTEPQRRAFIRGYNGTPLQGRRSRQMVEQYRLGLAVRAALLEGEKPD